MLFMNTARHAPEHLSGQELRAAGADGLVAEYAEARALVRRGTEEAAGGEGELLARIGKPPPPPPPPLVLSGHAASLPPY